ncbi:mycothiol synthase [Actinocorallia longicatena]|uniref:Mycothiol acetyltransferase n=1 Tax=Actinocorallia longicatena TaxID=111803 RepID=A0ABP6QN23_9ACTN
MTAVSTLSAEQTASVLSLAQRAEEHDGTPALSEQTLLAVRHGGGHHILHHQDVPGGDRVLAGYGFRDDSGSAELVVDPSARRQGHGRALVALLGDDARIWAHGDLPEAAALAAALGLSRVRALFQLRRPLSTPLPVLRIHAGFALRTFEPTDAEAWLRLNTVAFADHPEQGQWTLDDLNHRLSEPWFDPQGFFLATKGDRLVGFHWTKIHPEGIGEVYVVGVDPSIQGVGLGRTLTLAGLHYLKSKGLTAVLLYVDESNTGAVRLYDSLGFTRHHTDVMYAKG